MVSDDDLMAGFEAASLAEFHHADHVRLTILYLAHHGRDEALRRLTAGIRRLAAADGHPEKFHVTMTRAWLDLIDAARAAHPEAASPAALVAACPELLDRHALRRCYSRERLESERARTEWMPPDLAELGSITDRKIEI
jgi:nitroreductase